MVIVTIDELRLGTWRCIDRAYKILRSLVAVLIVWPKLGLTGGWGGYSNNGFTEVARFRKTYSPCVLRQGKGV